MQENTPIYLDYAATNALDRDFKQDDDGIDALR